MKKRLGFLLILGLLTSCGSSIPSEERSAVQTAMKYYQTLFIQRDYLGAQQMMDESFKAALTMTKMKELSEQYNVSFGEMLEYKVEFYELQKDPSRLMVFIKTENKKTTLYHRVFIVMAGGRNYIDGFVFRDRPYPGSPTRKAFK